jgi:hypothetical protein
MMRIESPEKASRISMQKAEAVRNVNRLVHIRDTR